jgi:hypothetical protein
MAGRVGVLALAVPVIAVAGAAFLLATAPPSATDEELGATRAAFEEATGVRVIHVALTGGGGIVDLRYQVLDPGLAATLHNSPPVLLDERTREIVDDLFMGHAHSGSPRAGLSYPVLFVNAGGLIERGSTVSVVIGEERLEHVLVQ